MSSILHLAPFGDLAGAAAEKKLHHEIAMAFTRMSPVKVTRTAKPSVDVQLANTFSSMIEPVHREDFEELVRKACSEGGERE